MIKKNKLALTGVQDEQGYEITTKTINGKRVMVVSGGSILGEAYGLFWIADRLKVTGSIPNINTIRIPELKIRFSGGNSPIFLT